MASSPPFQVEDQTDESFFDNLVIDDDVDHKVAAKTSSMASGGPAFSDGDDSDEVKAFANLSINEVNDSKKKENEFRSDNSGAQFGILPNGEVKEGLADEVNKSGGVDGVANDNDTVAMGGVSNANNGVLASSNSFEFQSVAGTNSGNVGAEFLATNVNKSIGSGALGVKEVQWSAFTAGSAHNDSSGFGSYSDFFTDLAENAGDSIGNVGENLSIEHKAISGNELYESTYLENSDIGKSQDSCNDGAVVQQIAVEQDLNSSQYWENLYPGWKFHPSTGQWYQVDGYDASAHLQGTVDSNSASEWAVSDGKTDVSYLQQSVHYVAGTVPESGTTECVTNWNQVSQLGDASGNVSNWNQVSQVSDSGGNTSDWNQVAAVNNSYPSHMVFDPQYPGWYYDTIAQEWRSLDTYDSSLQSTAQAQEQQKQNGFASTDSISRNDNQQTFDGYGQVGSYTCRGQDYNWPGSFGNYNEQVASMWQSETSEKESSSDFSQKQQLESHFGHNFSGSNHVSKQMSNHYGLYEKANQSVNDFSAIASSQNFVPSGNFGQQYTQPRSEQKEPMPASTDYYSNQNSVNVSQQFNGGNQFSYAPSSARSSAGRPPHALVTFGFGGKLIVAKENSSMGASSFGSQNPVGSSISVLNLIEVVMAKDDASGVGLGASSYFHTLCRQSFPGPLTGGSGIKELNRWIDERISNPESPDMDYRKADILKLLLSLLKISCQYYGRLRSSFGSDTLRENDVPEAAVAKLFASAKRQFNEYGAVVPCLQKLPSEGQMRATAAEVQSLLVSGRKRDALQCAQEGQLWGPALVLAAQLGDQFYVDTVKQMALRQLVPGSPLRTLCLLIAGKPSDVFEMDASDNISTSTAVNTIHQPSKLGSNSMLDDWEENLAVITANRTKDDELVLIHLGDCIWKEKHDVLAAHICYLVAEANFEPFSDTARMCLLGADHWKFPRTYASPEAIQRTEIYEYSKVLGNSQFILLPFQPYKLVYAHMLAEVGRISDALKYCQSVLKSLKTGRAPEVESLRQLASSLEERIRTHQQGGFSTNLAPAKLVGKLLNLFDSTAHRVVGGLPPPVPSTLGSGVPSNEHHHQMGSRVSTSQSTMAMSSLMPSASMEPISEWASDSNRMTMHNRSVSEPDFGRSPRQGQVDSSKEASSTNSQGETSGIGPSRFGRFGFGSQLLQKTVGLVLRPRQGRQAKLGEKNKFYYDEKLKRWVEEGAEPLAEETSLPPPPMTAAFQNGTSDYSLKTALKSEGTVSNGSPDFKSPTSDGPGIPPLPPTSNQFSARARMGVRSRYVDTFNQGGGNQANLFQSPSVPSMKPAASANPKFFLPTPVSSVEERIESTSDNLQDASANNGRPSNININDSFQSPVPSSPSVMQRFGSMGHIPSKVTAADGSFAAHSRRTASWSGSFDGNFSPPPTGAEVKPLGEVLGMPPSTFMANDSSIHSSVSGTSYGDDLHEVEL